MLSLHLIDRKYCSFFQRGHCLYKLWEYLLLYEWFVHSILFFFNHLLISIIYYLCHFSNSSNKEKKIHVPVSLDIPPLLCFRCLGHFLTIWLKLRVPFPIPGIRHFSKKFCFCFCLKMALENKTWTQELVALRVFHFQIFSVQRASNLTSPCMYVHP